MLNAEMFDVLGINLYYLRDLRADQIKASS